MGPPVSSACQHNLDTFIEVCDFLGVPLAVEKFEGPTTCLTFLGITLDTVKMEIRLPEDKFTRIRQEISKWLQKRKATKKQILSLVGLLQHATKVVRCGRNFVGRMYSTAVKLKDMSYYTRLNKDFKSDLYWWYFFSDCWNGLNLLCTTNTRSSADYCIQTDASGSWGCGSLCGQQ